MIALGMIIILLIFAWLITLGISLAVIIDDDIDRFDEIFNPVIMYDNSNFNIFGVIAITIIGYIVLCPMAIIYWFYKLCTVGRR